MLHITNLAGIYTCEGFIAKDGRHPAIEDAGFVIGPIDIICDPVTGNIAQIGQNLSTPPGYCQTIDGTDLFATPGFIDCHTHAIFAGSRQRDFYRRWSGASYQEIARNGGGILQTIRDTHAADDGTLKNLLIERLRRKLSQGTTTVEVKTGYGGSPQDELRLLRIINDVTREPDLPHIHRTLLGLHALPPHWSESEYVDAMIGILDLVAEENLADSIDCFVEEGFFSLGSAERWFKAGAERSLLCRAHVDELRDFGAARALVNQGAISVDHLEKSSELTMTSIAESAAVAVLLPATSFYLGIGYPDARRLLAQGAKVALATDFNPGTAPNDDLGFTSLLAVSQLHMSPEEVLCALTVNAAAALGFKNVGGLVPGWRADVVLWSGISMDGDKKGEAPLGRVFLDGTAPAFVLAAGEMQFRPLKK